MQAPLSRENMIRGVILFTLFTVVGLVLSFLWTQGSQDLREGAEELRQVFQEMRYEYLLGAIIFMFVDWLAGGLRYHIFIKIVSPTIQFKDSFRAIMSTICVSAITPFQTGGVGHLYIYARSGVPFSGAITAGIAAFLSTLVVLICAAGGILLFTPTTLPDGTTWISFFSFLIFGLVFLTFLLLLFKPEIVTKIIYWLTDLIGRRFKPIAPFMERIKLKVEQISVEHKTFARSLIREHKWTCFLSLLLTCVFLLARVIGGYYILRAFNTSASIWDLCIVEMLYNFVVLFAPTPGASGFAEGTKSLLMKTLVVERVITPFVLLTRFFAVYCGVILGGIIISVQLTKDLNTNKEDLSKNITHQPIINPTE
ncbi:flippase-like domain-containing protein [Candidatus Poribacteria bacterium]|nr:flippase-like domain-containing protein [Candidatus Poribacteria bacterium]